MKRVRMIRRPAVPEHPLQRQIADALRLEIAPHGKVSRDGVVRWSVVRIGEVPWRSCCFPSALVSYPQPPRRLGISWWRNLGPRAALLLGSCASPRHQRGLRAAFIGHLSSVKCLR